MMVRDQRGSTESVRTPALSRFEEVEEVLPGAVGRWRIHSRNSVHLLRLGPGFGLYPDEASTYQRIRSGANGRFDTDGIVVRPTRIELWPAVGSRFLLYFDDPDHPELLERWHATSAVRRIERIVEE